MSSSRDQPPASKPRSSRVQPGSPPAPAPVPRRAEPPGQTGLAQERRPGLGADPAKHKSSSVPRKTKSTPEDADPLGRNQPIFRPEPQEQKNPAAREQERDTGASGQSGID